MSGEKMWAKRIEIDPVTVQGAEVNGAVAQMEKEYGLFGEVTGEHIKGWEKGETVLYDGRPDALADGIKQIYPVIMKKCSDLIHTEEVLELKEMTQEIRDRKRY
jgi:hypothetical protein